MAAAFDFAQKVVRSGSVQELVRLQTEFVQAQMQALSEQAKDLGEAAAKSVSKSVMGAGKDASKPKS